MRPLLLLTLLGLTACAVEAPTVGGSCQKSCNRSYSSCMDATGSFDNPQTVRGVGEQCERSLKQCQSSCS